MRKLILLIVLILLLVACSSIDCPLNSRVFTKYKLAGNVSTLIDTLTIYTETAANKDSVLINKDVKKDSFLLPMRYHREQDERHQSGGLSRYDRRTKRGPSPLRSSGLQSHDIPYDPRNQIYSPPNRLNCAQQFNGKL